MTFSSSAVPVRRQERTEGRLNFTLTVSVFETTLKLSSSTLFRFLAVERNNCNYERERLVKSGIPDVPLPDCDRQGSYKKVQCTYLWQSNECWCADSKGNAYWNTSVMNEVPDCSEGGTQ